MNHKSCLCNCHSWFSCQSTIYFRHHPGTRFFPDENSTDRTFVIVQRIVEYPGIATGHAENHVDPSLFKHPHNCFAGRDFFGQ